MDASYQYKLECMDLAELKAEQASLKARREKLRGNEKIVSMKTGSLLKTYSAKISAISTAIHVRENGLSKIGKIPMVGEQIIIRGNLHGRTDFESAQTVREVGETTFRTSNGWKFYCRHDGWIAAGHTDLVAIVA